jgi:hypothetical protein
LIGGDTYNIEKENYASAIEEEEYYEIFIEDEEYEAAENKEEESNEHAKL